MRVVLSGQNQQCGKFALTISFGAHEFCLWLIKFLALLLLEWLGQKLAAPKVAAARLGLSCGDGGGKRSARSHFTN